ncbi:molybdopterin synthase catalytic subunit [Candidatus Methanophagaceae archaeon]|nr:molybdopterin synthase catalytic subunit [Methanophagales archaeon]
MKSGKMFTEEDFALDTLVQGMKKPELGCIVSFIGVVRDDEGTKGMEIEIDEQTAKTELEQLKREALENFDIESVEIVHRKGFLDVSDSIVAILVGAGHRKEAFRACEHLIDVLRLSGSIRLTDRK